MSGQDLPIDIHYNKLLEWLINRRHCHQQWQHKALPIREAINTAIQDMPPVPEITQLLQGSYLNYFHCQHIVELLNSTDDGTKNIFGRYSSQRMKDWREILKTYETDGVYLAEAAQLLMRDVNYEIPALKKQISKCQQTQQDCSRKEGDYASHAAELQEKYRVQCRQMGIEGVRVKRELLALVDDLPVTCDSIVRQLTAIEPACHYYIAFISFTIGQAVVGEGCLPVISYLLRAGNTTVYEHRTGRTPSRVEPPQPDYGDELDATDDSIDWGGEIDFGTEDGGQEADGVDWGDTDISIEVVDDSTGKVKDTQETDVARGDDALSLLENTGTRNAFTDELSELEAFLSQRICELRSDTSVLSSAQFHQAPPGVHPDTTAVHAMRDHVNTLITQLTSTRMKELFLIRGSPRYVHRLAESLQKVQQDSERTLSLSRLMVTRRQEALEEQRVTEPRVDLIRTKTQALKTQIEGEISMKYKNRRVNIMGEINTV